MTNSELLAAFKAADKAFTAAVIAHFGTSNPGDARYRPLPTAELRRLGREYNEAGRAWAESNRLASLAAR